MLTEQSKGVQRFVALHGSHEHLLLITKYAPSVVNRGIAMTRAAKLGFVDVLRISMADESYTVRYWLLNVAPKEIVEIMHAEDSSKDIRRYAWRILDKINKTATAP